MLGRRCEGTAVAMNRCTIWSEEVEVSWGRQMELLMLSQQVENADPFVADSSSVRDRIVRWVLSSAVQVARIASCFLRNGLVEFNVR